MRILCGRCGADYAFYYCAANVHNAVYNQGWGSFGAALYCPECSKTWDERNKGKPMAGARETISLIGAFHRRNRRGGGDRE